MTHVDNQLFFLINNVGLAKVSVGMLLIAFVGNST